LLPDPDGTTGGGVTVPLFPSVPLPVPLVPFVPAPVLFPIVAFYPPLVAFVAVPLVAFVAVPALPVLLPSPPLPLLLPSPLPPFPLSPAVLVSSLGGLIGGLETS